MKKEAFNRAKEIENFINAHKVAAHNLKAELKNVVKLIEHMNDQSDDDTDGIISQLSKMSNGGNFESVFKVTGIQLIATGNRYPIEPALIRQMLQWQLDSHEEMIKAYEAEFDSL